MKTSKHKASFSHTSRYFAYKNRVKHILSGQEAWVEKVSKRKIEVNPLGSGPLLKGRRYNQRSFQWLAPHHLMAFL